MLSLTAVLLKVFGKECEEMPFFKRGFLTSLRL